MSSMPSGSPNQRQYTASLPTAKRYVCASMVGDFRITKVRLSSCVFEGTQNQCEQIITGLLAQKSIAFCKK